MPLPASFHHVLDQGVRLLAGAVADRRHDVVREVYDTTFAGGLQPRRLLDMADDPVGREAARRWFEAWDDVARGWWLADDAQEGAWRDLLLPTREGFTWAFLLLGGWWLRASGSERIDAPPPLPDPDTLRGWPLGRQARALGRYCLAADGGHPFDYEAVAGAVREELRPFLAFWLLGVHSMSPLDQVDPGVVANRERAMAGFAAFHRGRPARLPLLPVLGHASSRVPYQPGDPEPFLSTLNDAVLTPGLRPRESRGPRRRGRRRSGAARTGGGGVGVLLTCFREGHAVQRCIDPMLDRLRAEGVRAFCPSGDLSRLPDAWRALDPVDIGPANGPDDLRRAARQVREADLDLLLFPEVGLATASRWLASQRLARVQAAAYGHPVTTGSAAVDYFLGGAHVEPDAASYRERLVLLPGLGVSTTPPPEPSRPRTRPLRPERCRAISLATFDKLNAPLLHAWSGALADAGGDRAELHLLPGVPPTRARATAERLGPFFGEQPVEMAAHLPRQECIDRLADADVYLDTFPFGGFNSLVEALACGLPVVTLESRHAPGRFGAALLRRLGLPDWLVARTVDDYRAAVVRLLTDADARLAIRASLSRRHVLETARGVSMADHLAAAVAWMRAEGPGSRGEPVRITAEAPPVRVAI
ncbi:MAG: hypothetical protein ACQEXJ_13095 [Myxococcota bacterium]